MNYRTNIRYNMRKNATGKYWTVYDIFSGMPAILDGVALERCEMDEADDLADLLNIQYIECRGRTLN